MSATDVIKQIKDLPDADFQKVAEFVDAVRKTCGQATAGAQEVRPGFREAAREMFERYDELFRELAK